VVTKWLHICILGTTSQNPIPIASKLTMYLNDFKGDLALVELLSTITDRLLPSASG
jgi:hypothetical protein